MEMELDVPLRRPPTSRTPWLSKSCGLGFGQSQLGGSLLRAADLGDGSQVRRITQPTCSSVCERRLRWGTVLGIVALGMAVAELRRLTAGEIAADGGAVASPSGSASSWGSTRIDLLVLAATAAAMTIILLAMLQCMPDPGITANYYDEYFRTAMHIAAGAGHSEVLSILSAEGALVDARDWQLRTPLFYAALGGRVDTAKALLALGADVAAVDRSGNRAYRATRSAALWAVLGGPDTTLHAALRSRDVATLDVRFVEHLLSLDASVVNCPDRRGGPPLVLAAMAGRGDIVRALLAQGARVDVCSSPPPPQRRATAPVAATGGADAAAAADEVEEEEEEEAGESGSPCSALYAATMRGDLDVIRVLLDGGADVDFRNPLDSTQLQMRKYGVCHHHEGGGDAPLHAAAANDDGDALALLLLRGADIEALNATRQRALTIAIVESAEGALKLLLARGASCVGGDDDEIGKGSSPLHYGEL